MATPPKFALYRKLVREGRTDDAARMAAEFEHRGPTPTVVFMDEIADLDPTIDADDELDALPLAAGFDAGGHILPATPAEPPATKIMRDYLTSTPPVIVETPVSFTDSGSCDAGAC